MFINKKISHIINGGFMKKVIIVFGILLVSILIINKKDNTILVNTTLDNIEEGSQIFYLTIPNLNTKNFSNYFNDESDIVGIYPYVNPLYKNRVGNMFFIFDSKSLNSNMTRFIKYYKNILQKNNFNNDLVMIDYNGVNIEKVKLYIEVNELKEFLKKCSSCKYEKTSHD